MTEHKIAPETMVGEYRIVQQIGVGGMGEVYLAIHPVIGKRVAVKVLRPDVADDEVLVERFVVEARAVCSIEHQNIIDVFAFGRLPDGRHYYVMEYLNGFNLEEFLDTHGVLELDQTIALLEQVAGAVDAAHERDILHRDLKPENIFLVSQRSGGHRVVVLDFGIAKLMSEPDDTSSGLVVGTPSYMSPEQCMGHPLDSRSDLYALATICYRALTGRLPFEGDSARAVMYQHTTALPSAPSVLGSAPEVDAILLKGLEKNPGLRHETLSEFVSELRQASQMIRNRPDEDAVGSLNEWGGEGWTGSGVTWEENTEISPPLFSAKGTGKKTNRSGGRTTASLSLTTPIRLTGHSQTVHCVAYCPAGGILASAGDDHTVRLWSYEGKELAVFRGHTEKVEQLCFSPWGHLVASTGGDGQIILWSIFGGDRLREFRGHRDRVNSLAFSPNGEQLVSGGSDGSIRLWTISNGHCQVMAGHTSPVRAVAFSPSGKAIASASDDRSVRLWKDDCGQRIVLNGHQRTVYSVAFSPDGQFLASGGHDGLVIQWCVRDGKSKKLEGHTGIVWHVAYSPDGTLLASSSSDGTVRLWKKIGMPTVLHGHGRRVRETIFSFDGMTVATAGTDGTVRLWDPKSGRCKSILPHSGPARSVAFTPRGDWVASACGRASLVMTPISAIELMAAKEERSSRS